MAIPQLDFLDLSFLLDSWYCSNLHCVLCSLLFDFFACQIVKHVSYRHKYALVAQVSAMETPLLRNSKNGTSTLIMAFECIAM